MDMTKIEIISVQLPAASSQSGWVRSLIAKAEKHDGVAPLSEAFINGLNDERLGHSHLLIDDAAVAAYAPDGGVELVVDPEHRREGLATALINKVREKEPKAQFWAHGNLSEARALAEELGMDVTRRLLVMGVDGDALSAATHVDLPQGFEALNYTQAVEKFGKDAVEQAWLDANNDAFSWHPEQGGWSMEQLHQGMEAEWFDPAGVQLLYRGNELAGFHWTKMHPNGDGEVYVVGLASEFRGQGLGDPLLRIGLRHLVEQGAGRVILYVEADNGPAVARYEELGFGIVEDHVVYQVVED
ncbi:mycothiol synthase [Corynebacterium pilosum]|uniref:Mycothiol acetyltransferase n=1 Tax=Corynebacterium pilosum TaxID=35756 RepID=A0A376CJW5_9CORY|nr:MshD acetyltransferase [Corynebacterium pilosum]